MKKSGMWNSKINLQSQPGASAWAITIRMMAMPLQMDIVVSRFMGYSKKVSRWPNHPLNFFQVVRVFFHSSSVM